MALACQSTGQDSRGEGTMKFSYIFYIFLFEKENIQAMQNLLLFAVFPEQPKLIRSNQQPSFPKMKI